jgi:acetyltransferase-like isoleucine patch superfamily enzyme
MSFYKTEELDSLGFKSLGKNVLISRYSRLYNADNMVIGNNVRIDDFCMLSASNERDFIIDDYVHISAQACIYGTAGIHIKSFSNISVGVKVFTVSDSFCGNYLIGPTVPKQYRHVLEHPLTIEKHTVIGTNSVVMPGITFGEGVAIGANSLVNKNCEAWSIYVGSPIRKLKARDRKVLELEQLLTQHPNIAAT